MTEAEIRADEREKVLDQARGAIEDLWACTGGHGQFWRKFYYSLYAVAALEMEKATGEEPDTGWYNANGRKAAEFYREVMDDLRNFDWQEGRLVRREESALPNSVPAK